MGPAGLRGGKHLLTVWPADKSAVFSAALSGLTSVGVICSWNCVAVAHDSLADSDASPSSLSTILGHFRGRAANFRCEDRLNKNSKGFRRDGLMALGWENLERGALEH
jgi:hypothetical protein